jgi:hypothetical protein
VPARAALKPLVHGLASVVDVERARLGAVGERAQEVGNLAPASCPTRASRRTAYRPHAPHTMVKNHALRVRLALIFACITDRSPVGRHETGDGGLILKHAGKLGFEGVVSKTIDAPYAPGNRGLWRKAKALNRQEFVVVGFK